MKKARNSLIPFFGLVSFFPSFLVMAAGLDYPELLVTPRASERLQLEAKRSNTSPFTTHLPLQISATSTLLAGILQLGSVDANRPSTSASPLVGIGAGALWLGASIGMSLWYRPYSTGWTEVNQMNSKSDREKVAQERAAEETFSKASALIQRINWISFASQFGAGIFMLNSAKQSSIGFSSAIVATVASFTPLLFTHPYVRISDEQSNYKKRIYGTFSQLQLLSTPLVLTKNQSSKNESLLPGLLLRAEF